jgi:hypothetical protein
VKASKEEIGCPAVACIVHHSDHLTLNPSPEGEGLSSIPVGMVALFKDEGKLNVTYRSIHFESHSYLQVGDYICCANI